MLLRRALTLVLSAQLVAVTACDVPPEDPAGGDPADPSAGDPEPTGEAPTDPGEPATEGECPSAFDACGGELVGTWEIVSFCPADGGSLTQACESPWDGVQSCQGPPNSALCTLEYGGSITLRPDGEATVLFTAGIAVEYSLAAECALDAARGREPGPADAAEACASLGNEHVACTFADEVCACAGGTADGEGEREVIEDVYVVDGDELTIAPSSGEPIAGPYCVDGDTLTIQGPVGWAYWVLRRSS